MTESTPAPSPTWQPTVHLESGARIWLITDVQWGQSSFHPWSPLQDIFTVGAYDLVTENLGFVTFGKDIAYAFLKAGLPPPPWKAPLAFGVALNRRPHDGEEKGRYKGSARLIHLEPHTLAMAAIAKKTFAQEGHTPNAFLGMWKEQETRARKENAIEAAVKATSGPFSAGDIQKIVGKDVDVTPILRRLVEEKRLTSSGKKRWTRYMAALPKVVERSDWTG